MVGVINPVSPLTNYVQDRDTDRPAAECYAFVAEATRPCGQSGLRATARRPFSGGVTVPNTEHYGPHHELIKLELDRDAVSNGPDGYTW